MSDFIQESENVCIVVMTLGQKAEKKKNFCVNSDHAQAKGWV